MRTHTTLDVGAWNTSKAMSAINMPTWRVGGSGLHVIGLASCAAELLLHAVTVTVRYGYDGCRLGCRAYAIELLVVLWCRAAKQTVFAAVYVWELLHGSKLLFPR